MAGSSHGSESSSSESSKWQAAACAGPVVRQAGLSTAQRAIERLECLGIVKQVGAGKRDRVYCANALLDILEEPAHLIPGDH